MPAPDPSSVIEPKPLLRLQQYLSALESDPDADDLIAGLTELIREGDRERLGDEPERQLELARQSHEQRGEYVTVARLIEAELALVGDDRLLAASLYRELGRLRAEYLLDSAGARQAYQAVIEHKPDDTDAADALRRLDQTQTSWKKFAKRFVEEAESATDLSLKSSLLLRAACLAWENRGNKGKKDVDKLFTKVLEVDPTNLRAAWLYEHTLREREEWGELADHLLRTAERARDKQDRVYLNLRAARVLARKLQDPARAADCYERVLGVDPGNAEAMTYLVERFTEQESWDRLATLYEGSLRVPQKLDAEQSLLVRLGNLHAQQRGRPSDAEPYFARLRKLDAAQPAMLQFYRKHLRESADLERLLRILLDAQRMAADPARRIELAVEAAELAQSTQGAGERAIEAWKNVQRMDAHNARAAQVLKELYAKSEKWNALVEVLKTQIDATPDQPAAPKVALLRDLAAVYRDRLRLDGMLVNAYNAILRVDPHDRSTLDALAEKYRELGRWNDLINVLMWDAEATTEPERRVGIYLKVAELWLEHFSNHNQAAGPLEKVIEIDPHNQRALGLLRDIYERKRAWRQLFEIVKKQRTAASEREQAMALTLQAAALAADRLHRYEEAVALYREVVESPAHTEQALDALERLAEREKDWATLADVLDKQVERRSTNEERVRLLLKLGAVYADRRNDLEQAARVWQRILAIDPRQGRALRSLRDGYVTRGEWDALEALYARANDYEGLVEVLSSEADRTNNKDLRVELSLRAARLYEEKIGEATRAQRSYERVLAADPTNVRAARALAPIYEQEGKWSRLCAVLEVVLRSLDGQAARDEQLKLLARLRTLSQERVRDVSASFEYALRFYALAPTDPAARAALEQSAEAAQAFERVVEAYGVRAQSAEPEEASALWRRIASLANTRLGQPELAASYAERLLEQNPDDAEALALLEGFYRKKDRPAEMRRLLQVRLENLGSSSERRPELLRELAVLEEERLADVEAAASRYRELAEIDPDNADTWAQLDRLALSAGRHQELGDILERRRSLAKDADNTTARVDLTARLARLVIEQQKDHERAFELYSEVLEVDPTHAVTIEALEGLLQEKPELSSRIMSTLESAYERGGRFDKLAGLLKRRLAETQNEAEIRRLRLRSAEISGSQLGDASGAYTALEAAFLEEPEDTSLWERLSSAAEQAKQHRALAQAFARVLEHPRLGDSDRAELAARTAKLYDEQLLEPQEAEPFHKRVLSHDPKDELAFAALKELYTTDERWEELQALYKRRIDDTVDAETKLDLLLQVCFLFEEILEQPDKAIEAYRAVLALSPEHAPSRRTLERLYERRERYADLAALLQSNLDHVSGHDQVDTHFRLGELYETKLAEPTRAVDHFEAALLRQPHHLRAQSALARLLAVEGLRQRVAAILEPMYETQGAYSDLVRVLEIQLADRTSELSKAELWQRIGGLYESRLRDNDLAFNAFAHAVELYPADAEARAALARLSAGHDAYRRRRAQVLEDALAKADEPEVQIDLLTELGELLLDHMQDRAGAERCYVRLIELAQGRDEVVLKAARALERIHVQSGDHAALAVDLSRQVDLEFDAEQQEQLLFRLAELYERKLFDNKSAIDTQRKRLELDPNRVDALRGLERLYEADHRYEDLVAVLLSRQAQEGVQSERAALGRRIAGLYEEKLTDNDRAIEQWRENIAAFGPDRESLQALARLYEQSERHAELLDTLEAEIDLVSDGATRAGLKFRVAELLRGPLGEPERAIAIYEAALRDDPTHAGLLSALESIAQDPSSPLRRDAARAAAPYYEALARFDKLLAMLELLAQTDEPEDKLSALRRAATVSRTGLQDESLALSYLGRALHVAGSHPSLPELLDEFGKLAQNTGRYAEYIACLQEIAPTVFDAEQRVRVYQEIATVAQSRLADSALARASYRKALEEQPDDISLLDALIELDSAAGDHAALIDVLGRKASLVQLAQPRALLLERQADVYERGLDDAERAISVLEEVVVLEPLRSAFASLERLYARSHRYGDLASLYEQQIERRIGSEVEARYRLARTLRQHMDDTNGALEQLRLAIDLDPNHADSIALLETIMSEHGEFRALAAEVLEPGYLARMEWAKLTDALRARVDAESELDERKRLLVRLSQIYEEQLEDFDETLEVYARLFREDFRDEDVWEKLSRLAKVGNQWERLARILAEPLQGEATVDDPIAAKLARYVASLYDERVGDLSTAATLYGKALDFDLDDSVAFRALESLYRRLKNFQALLGLYTRRAEESQNDGERAELLHKRAALQIHELADPQGAMATYRQLLELKPDDLVATAGLEQQLVAAEDWPGLGEHLRFQIEQSRVGKHQLALKHRLADLLWTRLDDKSEAIETWAEVLADDAGHASSLDALERHVQDGEHLLRVTEVLEPAYRARDQWKKLIAIHESRLDLVDDPGEVTRLLSEMGELFEKRANDVSSAFQAYARAFAKDPEDETFRGHVDRLAAKSGAWAEQVAAYEAALTASQHAATKLFLLGEVARIQDERLGDPRASIAAYERALAIEPSSSELLDALESLHTMVADWRGLVNVLERKADVAQDDQERGALHRRVGSVYEDLINDREAAIASYQRAVEQFGSDENALEALDRLYGSSGRALPLFETLERRIALSSDPALRAELGLRLGFLADVRLHRTNDAISAYRAVLDDEPENATAIAHLSSLFERTGQWSELLENLRLQISLAEAPEERVRLRCRAGDVLLTRVFDIPEAIDNYREALLLDPTASEALNGLLELTRDDTYRMQAVEVVEPLLRQNERWDDLVTLIERKLLGLSDAIARRDELLNLAAVREHGQSDKAAAFDALTRALGEDASDSSLVDDLERLAADLGIWQRLYDALMQRAADLADATQASELLKRAGQLAERELNDPARAIESYRLAASMDDDADDTLAALDCLYTDAQRWDSLVDVIERRVSVSREPTARAELLLRLGALRVNEFNDGRGAFVAYSEVLDSDPSDERALTGMSALGEHPDLAHDVLDVLERCYRDTQAMDKVVDLCELRAKLAPTDAEKARLLREAARMWEQDLNQPRRALITLRRAFELDPGELDMLDDLEQLAQEGRAWDVLSGLAEKTALHPAFAGESVSPEDKHAFYWRIARWNREYLNDAASELACLRAVVAIQSDDLEAQQRLLELCREAQDQRAVLAQLRVLAGVEPDVAAKVATLHEAGGLALSVGDPKQALELYLQLLELAPEDAIALSTLSDLSAAQGNYEDAVSYLERWLDVQHDARRRVSLHHAIAATLAGPIGDSARAIAAYKRLLDEFPGETAALASLEGLYVDAKRYTDLEGLWSSELELADDDERRAHLHMRLAELFERQLEDPKRAFEQLRTLLEEQPEHAAAAAEFERLLAQNGSNEERESWLNQRVERAIEMGQREVTISCLWQLADLYEDNLEQREATLARIHEIDPSDIKAISSLVELYRKDGRFSAAASGMRLLVPLLPAAEAIKVAHDLAELAEKDLKDLSLAEQALRYSLALDADQPAVRERLKQLLRNAQAYEQLVELLEEERERAQTPAQQAALLREIASLQHEKLNDAAAAVTYLERAVVLQPEDRQALLLLCDLYMSAGRAPDAITVLEKLIASYGGRRAKEVAVLEHRLGQAYEGRGLSNIALKHYDNAFKIDLTSVPVLRDLGRLCLAMSDLERAQKTYRALLLQKLGPEHGITKSDVYFRLGDISLQQGDKVKAKAMLERAISEAGQHPEAQALLDKVN
jgi:golgin subfamily B member 1